MEATTKTLSISHFQYLIRAVFLFLFPKIEIQNKRKINKSDIWFRMKRVEDTWQEPIYLVPCGTKSKNHKGIFVKSQYFFSDIYALLLVGPVLWSENLRIYIHIYTNMYKYWEIRGLSHCSYFSPVVFVYIRFSGGVLFWFCHLHQKLQTN